MKNKSDLKPGALVTYTSMTGKKQEAKVVCKAEDSIDTYCITQNPEAKFSGYFYVQGKDLSPVVTR